MAVHQEIDLLLLGLSGQESFQPVFRFRVVGSVDVVVDLVEEVFEVLPFFCAVEFTGEDGAVLAFDGDPDGVGMFPGEGYRIDHIHEGVGERDVVLVSVGGFFEGDESLFFLFQVSDDTFDEVFSCKVHRKKELFVIRIRGTPFPRILEGKHDKSAKKASRQGQALPEILGFCFFTDLSYG